MQNLLIMTTCLVKINPLQSQVSVFDIEEMFYFIFGRNKYALIYPHITEGLSLCLPVVSLAVRCFI